LRHSPRRGFTLIELLVVIGIILVLIAIVVMGLRHLNSTAATQETAAEMKICTDALNAYQALNGLTNVEGAPGSSPATASPFDLPDPWKASPNYTHFQLPIYVDPGATGEVTGSQPESTVALADLTVGGYPGTLGDMGDKAGAANPRWSSAAVRNTQAVMFIFLKDPKNRALISALPPKRLLETPPTMTGGNPQTPYTIDAALPLDGWGNPIIYVPRGGIHVMMNPTNSAQPAEYIVRTSGTYLAIPTANVPAVGANDRPFFASSGQDGYFSDPTDPSKASDYAIDNIYSFQGK
jgi:prepilin-type N-terminal cleavage/methylation domain-containing protein